MLKARNISAFTLERDSITLQWEIDVTTEDLAEYTVSIWRAEGEEGLFTRVSQEMVASDVFEFQDRGVNLLSKYREFHYRVRITKTADNTYLDFGSTPHTQVLQGAPIGSVVMETPPDLEALEVIHRFEMTLREFTGSRFLAFQERTWGQRCGECWDHLKRRKTKSNCLTCFDTGLAGGFWRPVEVFVSKIPDQIRNQVIPVMELQSQDRIYWTGPRPRFKPRDVLASATGERFRVIAVPLGEKGFSRVRQILQVRYLSRDQIEYKLPIRSEDWPVTNRTSKAGLRQYIRATDINSYQTAIQDRGISQEKVLSEKTPLATEVESSIRGSDDHFD